MRAVEVTKTIKIPQGVEVSVDGRVVTVKGQKGTLTRSFSDAPVSIQLKDDEILVETTWPRKKEASLVGTIHSHINNMITGVTKGFTYKLKVVFAHFPVTVKIKGDTIIIENFTGERSPRIARIQGDSKVSVKGEDVIVQGLNLENVSQTAANMERATKVTRKDPRIFLDGIYIYERVEGMEG
ncbi:MAG TPA: 50S ribosomal protein L6 [Candidatus Krumholzibacteriaceae bacterium]|jgi:large subunit ribosomal protein L6|nr:50S ribosomal protein L6 [Candidatus Krumholzibacteriaceae bacterium]